MQSLVVLLTLVVLTAAMTLAGSATAGDNQFVGDEGVIGAVAGQPVSEEEYRWKVHAANINLDYLRGEIAMGTPNADFLQQFVDLIEGYGVDNAALGAIILDDAMYQAARDEGFTARPEDVQARVEQDLAMIKQMGLPESQSAYFEATGIEPERYWSEIYPEIIEREIVTQQLWSDAVGGVTSQGEAQRIWLDVQRDVVNDADVQWFGSDPSADVPGALACLEAIWALGV